MKRLLTILLMSILMLQGTAVHSATVTIEKTMYNAKSIVNSAFQFNAMELNFEAKPLLPQLEPNIYLTSINGVQYILRLGCYNSLAKYNEEEYNFFIKEKNMDYIQAGEYYMARSAGLDFAPGRYQTKEYGGNRPIKFYDKNLNFIKECEVNYYVSKIGYINGIYYYDGYMSTDTENWIKSEEQIPKQAGQIVYRGNSVSFTENSFINISYEYTEGRGHCDTFGQWIVRRDNEYNIYLSNDNVYFVKIYCPEDAYTEILPYDETYVKKYTHELSFENIYENGDDLIIEFRKENRNLVRLTVQKQDVYDALEALKNPIYVQFSGKILGFEQPPVLESDRTLVPMRFLFEQMGEEVTWNEDTQTATVKSKADSNGTAREIAFSIDDTAAKVDGANKRMDVPARLINDKTMVPIRFLSEELGYTVEWDENTNIITIG